MPARKTLTRLELAAAMKVSPRTVAKWLEEGMPVDERGRGGRASRYRLKDVKAWATAYEKAASGKGRPMDALAARAERDRWQAALAEQTHQLRARHLLPAAEVEAAWAKTLVALRAHLLALPVALPDRLERVARLEGVTGVERELEAAIHSALRELGELDITKAPPKPPTRSKPKRSRARRRRAA